MSPPIYAGGRLGFFVKSKPFGDKEWGNRDPKTKVEEKSKKVNTGWGPSRPTLGQRAFLHRPHPYRPSKAEIRAVGAGVCTETCLSQRKAPRSFLRLGGNYPSCNACKITVYFIFLKTPVINVRYRWSA